VSWRQVRTCSAGSGTYSVLTQGNFQGPPGSSAECRCGNTVSASGGSQTTFKPVQVRLQCSACLHWSGMILYRLVKMFGRMDKSLGQHS
jgi:hypothetical protein